MKVGDQKRQVAFEGLFVLVVVGFHAIERFWEEHVRVDQYWVAAMATGSLRLG